MDALKALIWNEWRQQRLMVLIMLAATLIIWGMMLVISGLKLFERMRDNVGVTCMICLFLLYCFSCTDSFTGEFTKRTDKFLLSMPVSMSFIYLSKYTFNFLIFLAMTISGAILFYPWIGAVFDGVSWIFLSGILLFMLVLHSVIFFLALIGRNNNSGILAILVFPVSFLCGYPGYLMLMIFFFKDDFKWAVSGIFLTLFVLYVLFFSFGIYLWTKRISRGLKIFKPLLAFTCFLLFFPWLLYLVVYTYSCIKLNSAIRAGELNGVFVSAEKFIYPPKHGLKNTYEDLSAFRKLSGNFLENKVIRSLKEKFPLPLSENFPWFQTMLRNRGNNKLLTLKEKYFVAEFILKNSEMNAMNSILDSALKKNYCYFPVNSEMVLWTIRDAVIFEGNRACAFSLQGNYEEFFLCLNKMSVLRNMIENDSLDIVEVFMGHLTFHKYETAVLAGPDNEEAVKYYENFIREIASTRLKFINSIHVLLTEIMKNPGSLIKDELNFLSRKAINAELPINALIALNARIIYIPWLYSGGADLIRCEIIEKNIFEKIKNTTIFPEIKNEYERIVKCYGQLPYKCRWWGPYSLERHFKDRTALEGYKLCFALKIYYTKHGKFPEKLEELCSEILSKIPLIPSNGEPFKYQKGYDIYKETEKLSSSNILGTRETEHINEGFTLKGGSFNIVYCPSDMKKESGR